MTRDVKRRTMRTTTFAQCTHTFAVPSLSLSLSLGLSLSHIIRAKCLSRSIVAPISVLLTHHASQACIVRFAWAVSFLMVRYPPRFGRDACLKSINKGKREDPQEEWKIIYFVRGRLFRLICRATHATTITPNADSLALSVCLPAPHHSNQHSEHDFQTNTTPTKLSITCIHDNDDTVRTDTPQTQ